MLSKEQILERNKLIGENGFKTRMKRAKQICKTKEDRDIHAANNMIWFYIHNINAPGTDVNMPISNKISFKEFVAKQESNITLVCC